MYQADDGWATTAPVGRYPLGDSPRRLHDTAGNVWAWTASGYASDCGKNPTTDAFVRRGGGWLISLPSYMRAAIRVSSAPTLRHLLLGFR